MGKGASETFDRGYFGEEKSVECGSAKLTSGKGTEADGAGGLQVERCVDGDSHCNWECVGFLLGCV